MKSAVATFVAVSALAGCQDNVATPFPEGLEPFEDNPLAAGDDLSDEHLQDAADDGDTIKVYGRGYVHAAPATLWALTKQPAAMAAVCSTDSRTYSEDNQPEYEYSFLVHYVVNDILTVEWDDQWRYGVVLGNPDAVELGMIKHQKVQGSDFITVSEGTVQVLATADPEVSELAFVEHLDAISGGVGEVLAGMQHNYDALVALAHGDPIPRCP